MSKPVGGLRGSVTNWSDASRRRLREALAAVDPDRLHRPTEITLTYPGDWVLFCSTGAEAKRHLRALADRWNRRFGARPDWIWKLEFQRRGAPHFQLMVSWPDDQVSDAEMRFWLAHAWYEIVGSNDPKHRSAGTRVADVRDVHAMGAYLAGYLTTRKGYQEVPPEGFHPGRWWNVPTALLDDRVTFALSPEGTKQARRVISRRVAKHVHRHRVRSQSLITEGHAAQLADRLATHVEP